MRYGVCSYCQTSIPVGQGDTHLPTHNLCNQAEGMPRCDGSGGVPDLWYNVRDGETTGAIEQDEYNNPFLDTDGID